MADIFSPAKRSDVMARIRSRGNARTEGALVRKFRELGITGWRRHRPVFGNPDFVFPKARLAVFVDGCFWHGCPEHFRRPKGNRNFWDAKIARNIARDTEVSKALRKAGWRVLHLWEHELAKKREPRLLARLRRWFGVAERP